MAKTKVSNGDINYQLQKENIKQTGNVNAVASPFDHHKRSKSSNGSNALATLHRQLWELAQATNSYAIKESFVKNFLERLVVLEGLMRNAPSQTQNEEYIEKLRFIESHVSQIKKREEILAQRENEVAILKSSFEAQNLKL
jgi:hypothetical protein